MSKFTQYLVLVAGIVGSLDSNIANAQHGMNRGHENSASTQELIVYSIGNIDLVRNGMPGPQRELFSAIRNPSLPPELRQYRYQPILLPEYSYSERVAKFSIEDYFGKPALGITVRLDSHEAQMIALEAARKREGSGVLENNVCARKIDEIEFAITKEIIAQVPSAKLHKRVFNEGELADQSIRLYITAENADFELLKKNASFLEINYLATSKAVQTAVNSAIIKLQAYFDGSFERRLKGAGGKCYVSRDEATKLLQTDSERIESLRIIEAADRPIRDITELIINRYLDRTEFIRTQFNAALLASVFNQKDLQPDELEKSLESSFESTADGYRYNASGAGKFAFLYSGIPVGVGSSLSFEKIKDHMQQRGVVIEEQGKIIRPKALEVYGLNEGKWTADAETKLTDVWVKDPQSVSFKGTISLRNRYYSEDLKNLLQRVLGEWKVDLSGYTGANADAHTWGASTSVIIDSDFKLIPKTDLVAQSATILGTAYPFRFDLNPEWNVSSDKSGQWALMIHYTIRSNQGFQDIAPAATPAPIVLTSQTPMNFTLESIRIHTSGPNDKWDSRAKAVFQK